jgi:hypothetical protein
MYPCDQELGNKYIVNINSGLIQVSQVLVICFVRQNLVLGFVGQSFALGLMEYIGFVSLTSLIAVVYAHRLLFNQLHQN